MLVGQQNGISTHARGCMEPEESCSLIRRQLHCEGGEEKQQGVQMFSSPALVLTGRMLVYSRKTFGMLKLEHAHPKRIGFGEAHVIFSFSL